MSVEVLPIETAPRDGSWILAYDASDFTQRSWRTAPWIIATWGFGIDKWCDEEGYPLRPTGWIALPSQPAPSWN